MAIKHVDLFSGVGGICTGFKAAGIETVLAIEKIQSCVDTYKKNHPEVQIIHKDIRKVEKKEIEHLVGKIDIITSGMPCETFSTAGSKSRSFYDHRQQLYYEAVRIAKILKPKLVLFENVIGILSKKTKKGGNRLIIEDIRDDLSLIGYKYFIETTLNSSKFGIPQYRQRYFLIATNISEIDLKIPISKSGKIVTVDECFSALPDLKANEGEKYCKYKKTTNESDFSKLLRNKDFWKIGTGTEKKLTYYIAPKHRPKTIERFKIIKPGENLKDAFTKHTEEEVKALQEAKILPKKWYIQRNMRLKKDNCSKTVTSHCLDELLHPKEDRALTVREVARLQSFPDTYDFIGGPLLCPHMYETQDKYEQVGDAVPPLLAYEWAKTIKKILEKEDKMQNFRDFCNEEYSKIYMNELTKHKSKDADIKRRYSQKKAIKQSSINAIKKFPDVEPTEIWKTIYIAHVNNISGVTDRNTINKVISADNSWKKSSGHAFEEMICDIANPNLQKNNIKMILQKELNSLIKEEKILNEVRDISWLKEQVSASIFDIYLVIDNKEGLFVYGCVQSKTSIRDRVTRDREPSMNAMKAFFVSLAIVMDGEFLKLPKFKSMVNGGSTEFENNGWHSMYVLTNENFEDDRIKSIDISMEKLTNDCINGAKSWTKQRQWINSTWRP